MKNILILIALCLFSKQVSSQQGQKKYRILPPLTAAKRVNTISESLIPADAMGVNKSKEPKSVQNKSGIINQTSSIGAGLEMHALGKSANPYTLIDEPWRQVISYDPKSGTIMLVRRGGSGDNIGAFPGNSLFYDYSPDGGINWDVGLGPIYRSIEPFPSPSANLPRYPMGILVNPKKSADPQNVYGFFASGILSGFNNNWGGETFGIRRIATGDTSTLRLQTDPLIKKPEAAAVNSAGEIFVVQKEVDISSGNLIYNNKLRINKITIDTNTHQFTRTEAVINLPEDAPDFSQHYSGTNICFAKSGGIGYITMVGRMASQQFCPLTNNYLIVYKTSDNGTSWTGPHVADLTFDSDFSTLRDSILGDSAFNPTTNQIERVFYTFMSDFDSEVDGQGNLHFFGSVAAAPNNEDQMPGMYYPAHLGLVHFTSSLSLLNSNAWNCHFARKSLNVYGFLGDQWNAGNSIEVKFFPQISFSQDHNQILLSYCETDTVLFPALDNRHYNNNPNLFVRKGKLQSGNWSFGVFENLTNQTDLANQIFWPRMAKRFVAHGDTAEFFVSTCIIDPIAPNFDISLIEISHIVLHFNGKKINRKNIASGKAFNDLNQNCIFDSTDVPLANQLVKIVPGSLFKLTDGTGNFQFELGPGTYKIQIRIPEGQSKFVSAPCLTNLSSTAFTFSSDSGGVVSNIAIPFMVKQCANIEIQSTATILRPCRLSSYIISLKNNGTVTAENVKLYVKLPKFIHFLNSNTNLSLNPLDSSYSASIPNLSPNQSFTIVINDSVECVTNPALIMGVFQCFLSRVTFENGCEPTVPGWDGVDLLLSGKCSGNVRFNIKNKGTAMNAPRDFKIFKDSLFAFQQGFQLGFGDSIVVQVPNSNNASNYRIEAPQSLNHPNGPFASASTTCFVPLTGITSVMSSDDLSENSSQICDIIRTSYDPNDKQVWPPGAGPLGKTLPQSWLAYKIRFMNKGNDTAFKVVVVDSLSNDLDLSTFSMGMTSHPCKVKLSSGNSNVLSFIFDPIRLVDSITNTPASQGYIQFRIKAKDSAALGTTIKNRAFIYFDFNEAILTNYTINTLYLPVFTPGIIDSVQLITSNPTINKKGGFFNLFPNPGTSVVNIQTSLVGLKTFSLTDLQGRTIIEGKFESLEKLIDTKDLRQGTYFLNLKSDEEAETRKFIKN